MKEVKQREGVDGQKEGRTTTLFLESPNSWNTNGEETQMLTRNHQVELEKV